jgi:hypothetical protein
MKKGYLFEGEKKNMENERETRKEREKRNGKEKERRFFFGFEIIKKKILIINFDFLKIFFVL